ncbi:MAG: cupin domain-containing protein [Myxococcales bacterium]|nr:cupin domain-containing protein [Myxococcota bacterium]MDW8281160.1 cupin domain-containing protein [Myxococcales bacterium]
MRAAAVLALVLSVPPVHADEALGRRVQLALRERGAEIHGCYAAVLDRDPVATAELLLQLELGPGGQVRRVQVLQEQGSAPGLGACLVRTLSTWTLPGLGAEAGDRVVFPLVFRPDPNEPTPPLVVPERAARVQTGSGGTVRVFIDRQSHPGTEGSVALLRLRPGPPPPLHRASADTTLYILSGAGRLHGPGGSPRELAAGDGVLVPAGARYALSAGDSGLSAVRFESTATRGATVGQPVVVRGAEQQALPLLGGQGSVRILIDEVTTGRKASATPLALSLEELSAETGAQVPLHTHERSDELIYVISGQGLMTAGTARDLAVGAGDVVRLPRGLPHALRVVSTLRIVQSYAPAGPEQRFRSPPPSTGAIQRGP